MENKKMTELDLNKLYSIGEVATILEVSEITIRRRVEAKKITYIQDGTIKIPGSAIVEYIENHIQRAENS
jgi:excisionase family DNA binding protein